jgi:hypothetical protein
MWSSHQQSGQLMNKFPHDRGRLHDKYVGGGRNGNEGKVVGEGWSGGCGGDCPRTASLMSSGSLRLESLAMTEHTHKMRTIQAINNRVANTRTKTVGASAMKTMGVLVVYILLRLVEWEFRMKGMNENFRRTLVVNGFSQNISPCSISTEIIIELFITKLIRDVIIFFFIIIVFTMVRGRVDMMEQTILWVMLR